MPFGELFNSLKSEEPPLGGLKVDRPELFDRFSPKQKSKWDLLVIGGGIHGACFARLAALNGLRTVLLERDDYASGTSSRSSKMAHGGLRYLEMFDFKQVLEGIKAREDLFETAGHLAFPWPFLYPVKHGWFQKTKLACGLMLYDRFLKDKSRRHNFLNSEALSAFTSDVKALAPHGAFRYFDGIMRDSRLVMENILAARQEGATCLNYAEVLQLAKLEAGSSLATFQDRLSGKKYQIECGMVVNCAGPWVPALLGSRSSSEAAGVRYSQGIHLIFNKPWNGPALIVPMDAKRFGKGRYYFVWPHFAGTMVGTTERELHELPRDPVPEAQEISELLELLKQDLPLSGLIRTSLHYAFAGVRTLPLQRGTRDTAKLSRRHIWSWGSGMLSLVGGKFTTASSTVEEGLIMLLKMSEQAGKFASLRGRKLPGAANLEEVRHEVEKQGQFLQIPPQLVHSALSRFGGLMRYFLETPEYMEPIGGQILKGEVLWALDVEQAEGLEDIVRRRLELEFFANRRDFDLSPIEAVLKSRRPNLDLAAERQKFESRMQTLLERGITSEGDAQL